MARISMIREMSARVWARELYHTTTLVCDLKKGDLFRWPGTDSGENTYLGRGWYRPEGKTTACRTGMLGAVVKR